ncbi:MAG: glycosyltransferase family 2 protein [Lachnospiraceae bacterium]|nr:glycosyltransferase family 2 protein [Lachnospiraceae bacterium]
MEIITMLFSVVIPVYNVEKYLDECLKSIIPQAKSIPEGCEIILVDDGSTDSSGQICDEYREEYPELIQVFHRTNHGLLLTRRFGYQHITGEYVINCDSDDFMESDAFETLRSNILEYYRPDIIIFNYNSYMDGTKELAFRDVFTNKASCKIDKIDVLKEFLSGYRINSVCGGICKSSCIDTKRDYSIFKGLNNGEDSLQKIEQFKRAESFVYVNKPLYDYRTGSGMTGKFDPQYYESFKVVFSELLKERDLWNFEDSEQYFAIKVLSISGRAITQSRYKKWNSTKDHARYLLNIRQDEYFKSTIKCLSQVEGKLQKDHVLLIKLLNNGMLYPIIWMLHIKNRLVRLKI